MLEIEVCTPRAERFNMADQPDYYTDHVRIATSDYGVTLVLGLTQPFGSLPEEGIAEGVQVLVQAQAQVRMSLVHAKAFAMILNKSLKQWESSHKQEIAVPGSVLKERGLKASEW